MNRFIGVMENSARRLKRAGIDNPTKAQLEENVLDLFQSLLSPEARAKHIARLQQRGVVIDDATMMASARVQFIGLCYDMLSTTEAVVIHVSDKELVEALRNTDVDALIGDVMLPFPVMEFRWPDDTTPIILIDENSDVATRQIERICKQHMKFDVDARRHDGRDHITTLAIASDGETIQLSVRKEANVLKDDRGSMLATQSDRDLIVNTTRLAFCCLLYAQTQPGLLVKTETKKVDGAPPAVGRLLKKRQTYHLTPLYRSGHSGHHDTEPGDRKVRGHWRIGHMRALRDERYKRNQDGSVKVVWVRPTRIHPDAPVAVGRALV